MELIMNIKHLSVVLAVVLATSPALAATKKKIKKAKPAVTSTATQPAVSYPVAGVGANNGAYTANMIQQTPSGQIPQSPEQWFNRMSDFTQNASAFKDPRTFEAWLSAMTNPATAAAAIPWVMEPGNWLHTAQSTMQPQAINNYAAFLNPDIYLRWTQGMMDPNFYMRSMWAFMDPNRMMQWMMFPMNPAVMQGAVNMMNPNTYMKFMMMPTDPRGMSLMMAPFNPQLYGSMMGTFINPNILGSNWVKFMNPATPVVAMGPPAPLQAPINVLEPSTWSNIFNMFGGFGGIMPSYNNIQGGIPAPSINMSGMPIPGFGPGPNPYLAYAQGVPATTTASASAPEPEAMPSFQPGTTAAITLSGDALFKSGKSSIKYMSPEGKKSLDELATRILAAGKIDTIRVTGHADKTGKASANMRLSVARARAVANYLKSKGVRASRFISTGKGDTQPVKECDMKLPKAELVACLKPNRRVEVDVTPAK
jgi:outer membrane protein OmpA-like peptidoglycan-associated protein